MRARTAGIHAAVLACLLALPQTACVPQVEGNDEPAAEATAAAAVTSQGSYTSLQLQHEISQVLWGCFAVGADLVGLGQVQAAKDVLRDCFSDDMTSEAIMPPAYAGLGFTTSGGADGWVEVANQIYRGLQLTRAQHLITNIVVEKTGPHTAIAHSGAFAVHVYPDEHVFNATVKFVDTLERMNGKWKITHRTMTLISASQAAAWVP